MLGLLSTEEPREDREDGPLPLIESVSLDHEKAREVRVGTRASSHGDSGGVTSPIGMRWSPSLCERLSLRIASFSSIVARVSSRAGQSRHNVEGRRTLALTGLVWHSLCALDQVKDAHGEGSRAVSVGCHSPLSTALSHKCGKFGRRRDTQSVRKHYHYTANKAYTKKRTGCAAGQANMYRVSQPAANRRATRSRMRNKGPQVSPSHFSCRSPWLPASTKEVSPPRCAAIDIISAHDRMPGQLSCYCACQDDDDNGSTAQIPMSRLPSSVPHLCQPQLG
jgi:hypothetical protein